jgi:hypothetical protein
MKTLTFWRRLVLAGAVGAALAATGIGAAAGATVLADSHTEGLHLDQDQYADNTDVFN